MVLCARLQRYSNASTTALSQRPALRATPRRVPPLPWQDQPEPLTILQLGQFANDLAIGEIKDTLTLLGFGAGDSRTESAAAKILADDNLFAHSDHNAFQQVCHFLVLLV